MPRAIVSLALIACLVATAAPVSAQEWSTTPAASPLARAITQEALRLAAGGQATTSVTSITGTVPQADQWDRVRALTPGTDILVAASGFYQGRRSLVSADESALTVLMTTDPRLPRTVVRIARADVIEIRMARIHYTGHAARRALAAIGGAFAGYLAGAMAGGVIGGAVDCSIGGCGRAQIPAGVIVGLFAGAITGGVGGGVLGYRAASDKTHDVIYRAP